MDGKYWLYYGVALLVIMCDQVSKVWVHQHMTLWGPGVPLLGKWISLEYVLNPGMAFGLQLPFLGQLGKLLLTVVRVLAVGWIARHIVQVTQGKRREPLVAISWALILGGAIGNVIDSLCYGIIFDNAPLGAPMALGYGQVIDMIRVGIHHIQLPTWLPWLGGRYLPAFPVFNIADSAISSGVALMLLHIPLASRRRIKYIN